MIVAGILVAMFSTIIFELISLQIGWNFSIFNILTGYFTGFIILKIARYGNKNVGIISVVCYVLSAILDDYCSSHNFTHSHAFQVCGC